MTVQNLFELAHDDLSELHKFNPHMKVHPLWARAWIRFDTAMKILKKGGRLSDEIDDETLSEVR